MHSGKIKNIFITGTDTGVGKTIVTGLLARFLCDEGREVITQKWVETGTRSFSRDVLWHLRLMGRTKRAIAPYIKQVNPYCFRYAASPHLAANLENRKIDLRKIARSYKILSEKFDHVIVEGAGGVIVPLDQKKTIIDCVAELSIPAIIVAGNKLGAINHTLLTIEALRQRNVPILGVVFNNCFTKQKRIVLNNNVDIIKKFGNVPVLGVLSKSKNMGTLYKSFIPIGERVLDCKLTTVNC